MKNTNEKLNTKLICLYGLKIDLHTLLSRQQLSCFEMNCNAMEDSYNTKAYKQILKHFSFHYVSLYNIN